MAQKTIIPTRMELTKQKKKLFVARRGHKLLKDKRDEMMRQFLFLIRDAKNLRESIDLSLKDINDSMSSTSAHMDANDLSVSLMFSKERLKIESSERSVLNLKVPVFNINKVNSLNSCMYGLATTYSGLDDIVKKLFVMFKDMLKLAECENACRVLSEEIQKANRRVNALEHVVIPQANSAIKFVSVKIEELELSTAIRLLKVKDMMIAK